MTVLYVDGDRTKSTARKRWFFGAFLKPLSPPWARSCSERGRWTLPSPFPSTMPRTSQTLLTSRPSTGPFHRCRRGWRRKKSRYVAHFGVRLSLTIIVWPPFFKWRTGASKVFRTFLPRCGVWKLRSLPLRYRERYLHLALVQSCQVPSKAGFQLCCYKYVFWSRDLLIVVRYACSAHVLYTPHPVT